MKHVLVIGGGMGGFFAAKKLYDSQKVKVTLVDKKDYFEVTFAQLRGLVDPHGIGKASRFPFSNALGGSFVQGEVVSLEDQAAVLADGKRIAFDKVILAPGSHYPRLPLLKSEGITTLEARNAANVEAYARFQKASGYLVVGGGVVGVELAGELAAAAPGKKVRLAHSGQRLVENLAPAASVLALTHLKDVGVEVLLGNSNAVAADGEEAYFTVSPVTSTDFLADHAGLLDAKGRIIVDDWLRIPLRPHWYAMGDASAVGDAKHGATARAQAYYIAKHVLAETAGKGGKVKPYATQPATALVPIGKTRGFIQLPFGLVKWKFMLDLKRKDFFISMIKKEFS